MPKRYAVPSPRSLPLALGAAALAAASTLALSAGAASAVTVGPLVKVSDGDLFANCKADQVGKQPGTNYPNTEIEPWIAANPTDPKNVLAGWQQDRWSGG